MSLPGRLILLTALVAAPLAAADPPPVPPPAPLLPFPAPYTGPISIDAKFASGPIITIDPEGKFVTINTLAVPPSPDGKCCPGALKVMVEPTSRILGVDKQPVPLKTALRPSMYVRLYYVVRDNARLEELDVLPGPMR